MTSPWNWFVVIGTLGSLAIFLTLLVSNRKVSSDSTTGHDYDGIQEYDNPLPLWWVWMFALTIFFGLGYLAIYPGLGNFGGMSKWSSASELEAAQQAHEARFAPLYASLAEMDAAQLHQSRQALQVGRRLFINNCSSCHGVNARGAFGFPNLTDDAWLWGSSFDQVKATITGGRQAAMPPWGPALGDQGVADVTQYVLELSGNDHDADAAARGQKQFQTFCVACHGPEGKGNPILGAPDLTNNVWLYGGTAQEIGYTVRNGRNGRMPSFDGVLSEDKIHVLSGYVTSLASKEQ